MITLCSSRLCPNPPIGIGPVSGLSLCAKHLEVDESKAAERQANILRSLRLLRETAERQQALKQEFETLSCQLSYVRDTFEVIRDSIQIWSDKVVWSLQQAQDSVSRKLNDTVEAMDCEKELTMAHGGSDCDKRRMMELVKSAELWLDEANERSAAFWRTRGSTVHLVVGVQKLQQMIDSHINQVMPQAENTVRSPIWPSIQPSNPAEPSPQPLYPVIGDAIITGPCRYPSAPPPTQQVCRLINSIGFLPSEPYHVAVGHNTVGFACDSSNRIVKLNSDQADQYLPLPQPSIFISFLPEPECVDYLLVTSLSGHIKINFRCSIDWSVWINGLHFDNTRQLLFIAQANTVTVATLSGEVTRVISGHSLGQTIDWISSIAGSEDRIFILDNGKNLVLCVNKESGLLVAVVNGDNIGSGCGGMHELAQNGDVLLVAARSGQAFQLSMSDPKRILGFMSNVFQQPPWKMSADSARQLLFASEPDDNAVLVLHIGDFKGPPRLLQTLALSDASAKASGSHPRGLAFVQLSTGSDLARRLVVADSSQMKLLVYEIM